MMALYLGKTIKHMEENGGFSSEKAMFDDTHWDGMTQQKWQQPTRFFMATIHVGKRTHKWLGLANLSHTSA